MLIQCKELMRIIDASQEHAWSGRRDAVRREAANSSEPALHATPLLHLDGAPGPHGVPGSRLLANAVRSSIGGLVVQIIAGDRFGNTSRDREPPSTVSH